MSILDSELNDAGHSAEVRRQCSELLAPLTPPSLKYRRVWRRPLSKLPVWKDLPRLIRGLVVSRSGAHGDETLYAQADEASNGSIAASISKLIPVLARHVDGEEAAEALLAPLAAHLDGVADRGDLAAALQAFLSTCDAEAGWVQLLKCMHQEMLAPAVIEMHEQLGGALGFKDLRGAWRLTVHFGTESVTVTQHKGETSLSPAPEDFFKFHWVCSSARWVAPPAHAAHPSQPPRPSHPARHTPPFAPRPVHTRRCSSSRSIVRRPVCSRPRATSSHARSARRRRTRPSRPSALRSRR